MNWFYFAAIAVNLSACAVNAYGAWRSYRAVRQIKAMQNHYDELLGFVGALGRAPADVPIPRSIREAANAVLDQCPFKLTIFTSAMPMSETRH